jgi:ABC-type lipoprotein release transport system permease subunit
MAGPSLPKLAWRNLWRNPRRTLITLAAIAFGVFLAVMFTALQDRSFADMIDLAARLGNGHVVIQHPEYADAPAIKRFVADSARHEATALADPDVERVVQRVTGNAMVASAANSYGIVFLAVDPASEDDTTLDFLEGVVAGELPPEATGNWIVLGTKLAANLEVGLGDKVVYTTTDSRGEIVSELARVRGLVGTGAPSVDAALAILPIDTTRAALNLPEDASTMLAVFLDDSRRSPEVRSRLRDALGGDVTARTWDEVQPQLSGFIAIKVGGARFMELVILILVVASIFNTLLMSVLERTREFGILLALGFTEAQVFLLVIYESAWLALVGLVVGGLLTAGPYAYLSTHPIDVSAATQGQSMEVAGVGNAAVLNVGIYPENAVIIAIAIVTATLLAGLYPAWRAGRTVPVDSLKLV